MLKTAHNDFDERNTFIVPKTLIFLEERAEQPEEKEEERGRRKGRREDGRPLKSSTSR